MITTAQRNQHVHLPAARIQSGQLTSQERQVYERGMHLKQAVDMLIQEPEQFEGVEYKRLPKSVHMLTHNAEGQTVQFSYGKQPSQSTGFRRLVSSAAQRTARAAMAVGGAVVPWLPTDPVQSTASLLMAVPVSLVEQAGRALAKDPEQQDQVYHRSLTNDALGRVLVSETLILHPDGSCEYLAR